MRKALALLLALAVPVAALAKTQLEGHLHRPQSFRGSRGFLKTCEGKFVITNNLKGSSNFTSIYWTAEAHPGGTSPSVSTTLVTAPDGNTTAYEVTFPRVSGASHFSVLNQSVSTVVGPYPFTVGVWAKIDSSYAANGPIFLSMTGATSGAVVLPIPADSTWHLVNGTIAARALVGATTVQIGVNTFNSAEAAGSTGTVVVDLWGAFVIPWPQSTLVSMADMRSTLSTTSSATVATLTKPCPRGVAFRNFKPSRPTAGGLAPVSDNPILLKTPGVIYQSGGISSPYVYPPMYYRGYYWGFANTSNSITPASELGFVLVKSKDGIHWTQVTTNAPYMKPFGSADVGATVVLGGSGYDGGTAVTNGTLTYTGTGCSKPPFLNNVTTDGTGMITAATFSSGFCTTWPNASTAWTPGGGLATSGTGVKITFASINGTGSASHWQIHPAWLPYGCSDGTNPHPFCVVFGAQGTNNHAALFMGYSDTIDGVYTLYGCTSGTCSTPTAIIPQTGAPNTPAGAEAGYTGQGTTKYNSLPGVVNVGGKHGTNYIFTSNGEENGTNTFIWTTPADPNNTSSGNSVTWDGYGLVPHSSGTDWDYGSAYQDNQVYRNKCGFYEYFYTAEGTNVAATGKGQVAGYAVSDSVYGPWWKYPAPIVPVTSSMYGGATYLGDWSPISIDGKFILLMNSSNGLTGIVSAASMPDACAH